MRDFADIKVTGSYTDVVNIPFMNHIIKCIDG
jgi:hypothetical protein